ncbi:hypothetical protein GGR57DRAFT_500706 [Xylariaceae sp. FL1272]|nr:hypothetical protein GGR57DRAFT_500706 [Xylariaceae sp. FL1272]
MYLQQFLSEMRWGPEKFGTNPSSQVDSTKSCSQLIKTTPHQTFAMAALTFTTSPQNFGRSGYNKDGDNEDDKRNFGRSGYNKDGDDEDNKRCFGRSGYNKDGDDDDDKRCFGRSGYN